MLEFHPLTVTSIEKIAEDAVCISLAIPPALQPVFTFHAGQYVPLRRTIDGREERRTYSIVTAPGGALLKLGVRVQANGRMSAGRSRSAGSCSVKTLSRKNKSSRNVPLETARARSALVSAISRA